MHLSAGDLLRAERNSGSEDADLINEYIREGKIVPVQITCKLIEKAMQDNGWDETRFLIDGFPRSKDNLDGWEETMGDKADVEHLLFLNTSEEIMTERILKRAETSGRIDDNEDAIRKRLQTYNEATMPIIELFRERGKVVEVDASKAVEEVYADIVSAIGN